MCQKHQELYLLLAEHQNEVGNKVWHDNKKNIENVQMVQTAMNGKKHDQLTMRIIGKHICQVSK